MKSLIVIGVMAAFILMPRCVMKAGSQVVLSDVTLPKDLVAQSPIIAYAKADTNSLPMIGFAVTEVWKGSREASVAGITNGMQFPTRWPANGGSPPYGAILFFRPTESSPGAFELRAKLFVPAGIGTMSIQDFKVTYGL